VTARQRIKRALAELDPFAASLALTLLVFLLRPIGVGWVRPALLLLAVAGLLVPALRRSSALWLTLAGLTGWRVVADWPLADNHSYLLCYWCLAIGLGLLARDPADLLALSARRLLALAFGLAVVRKLLSPDYLDGTFFRVTLLVDPRFEDVARLAGGLTPELLDQSREALWQHLDGLPAKLAVPALGARFDGLALFLTLWTIALEALIAIAFLWPGRALAGLRDGALLLFCTTTYAVMSTIADFGWLLVAMGLSQCDAQRTRTRLAYLAVFALILLCRELPVHGWLS
jgi:hypothetical protein